MGAYHDHVGFLLPQGRGSLVRWGNPASTTLPLERGCRALLPFRGMCPWAGQPRPYIFVPYDPRVAPDQLMMHPIPNYVTNAVTIASIWRLPFSRLDGILDAASSPGR